MKTIILIGVFVSMLAGQVYAAGKPEVLSKNDLVSFAYGYVYGLRFSIALTGADPGNITGPESQAILKSVFEVISTCIEPSCVAERMKILEKGAKDEANQKKVLH